MCGCRSRLNELLKPRNGRLAFGFTFDNGKMDLSPPLIETEKLVPRGKKPPTVVAMFCPFCGEKYKGDASGAALPAADAKHTQDKRHD